MSTYVREKVLRYPLGEDLREFYEEHPDFFGFADVERFCIAPTEGNFVDYVLEYEWDACSGDFGKTRSLHPSEQEKYRALWQQIVPDIDMTKVRLVEFCWYNCCEAPDYYDEEHDPFYAEI